MPPPSSITPWISHLLAGLAYGTLLDSLLEDMSFGSSFGIKGAITTGVLWGHLSPVVRRPLPGLRDRHGR